MLHFSSPQTAIRNALVTSLILASICSFSVVSAQAAIKVPVKPVEPFFQEISAETPRIYQPKVTYLSPEKVAPIEFSSLGATWKQILPNGTSIDLEVRLKNHGKYSDWYPLEASIDQKDDQNDNSQASSFLTTSLADGYQYRISLNSMFDTSTPVLDNLKFTFINGGSPQQKTDLLLAGRTYQTDSSSGNSEYLPDNFDSLSAINSAQNPSSNGTQLQVASTDTQLQVAPTSSVSSLASTALVALAESVNILPSNIKPPVRPVRRQPAKITSTPTPGSSNITDSNLKIISRADWGADESLRLYSAQVDGKQPQLISFASDYYTKFANELKESKRVTTDDQGNLLTWPLSYPQSIQKIVIHHTATTKDLNDPKTAIRDIYIWHTLSKGWGDIGYNYIIDQQGNIYEGRYGGEMVVGAHAGAGNHGSIGIAILGNFQDNDPPQAVLDSLTALIKEKATMYHIDTEGASLFRGVNYPNVMGHRDIMSTSCPGDKLYAMLPIIRKLAKVNNATTAAPSVSKDYDFAWAGNTPLAVVNPSTRKTLSFKIKNTGTKTWSADTYFQIRPDQNSKTFLKNSEKILSSKVGKIVKPGTSVDIQILTNSTATSGSSLIDLMPIINGSQTVERYLSFGYQVKTPAPKLKYNYELLSVIYNKSEFKKGDIIGVTVRLRNKGTAPWQKTGNNKVDLGADKPQDHLNTLLVNPSSRLANMNEDLVQSGQLATFTFQIKVPSSEGLYKEYFSPVVEGIQWMQNHSSFIQVRVGNSDKLITTNQDPEGDPVLPSTIPAANPPANTSGGSSNNIALINLDTTVKPRSIRIDLSYRGNPAVISANGNFSLYEGVNKLTSFTTNQKVTVEFINSVFQVSSASGNWTVSSRPRFVSASGTILRIDNWDRPSATTSDNQFRGILEVIFYNDELHVINELPLEDYLKGISEEPSSEPAEKIKTIMVIARTYARFYMDVARKFPDAPFDLTDSPVNSQKYTGYSFEIRSPETAGFAASTAGQYVTYQGKLIKTPFFSASDGTRTISAKDKWGWTDAPFLTSVDDSLCKSTAFSGHGVGLSGCGATAMANLGKTYDQIIKYYYQGTDITRSAY